MSKSKKNKYLSIYIFSILIFLLSLININSYLFSNKITPASTKVLGAEIANNDAIFWYDFLQKNPTYIPGWLEIGRPDKARAIDPNYF